MGWSGDTFTRTNGTHTGTSVWQQDRDAGTKIVADRHDTNDNDLATGINTCINKTGANAFTGNANLGSQKIVSLADGTAHTDGVNAGQIQDGGLIFQATDSGSADAYVIALSPAITAYVAGQEFNFKAGATSTGASTLNVNGVGVKNIKKKNDQAIAAGDIEANAIIKVLYDGTSFQMLSQTGTTAGVPDSTASVKGIVIVAGTSPVSVGYSSGTATVAVGNATTSAKGAASFSSDNFAVSSGAVTIKDGGVDLTAEVTGTLPVNKGGTGAATHTANNVLIGAGTSAVTSVAPGTNGNVLTSNGTVWASAAASGGSAGLVFISSVTASDDATLSFTSISSTYAQYVFTIEAIRPATSSAELYLLTSSNNGSSYDTGGSDYSRLIIYYGGSTRVESIANSAAFLAVGPPCGNASNDSVNGTMELHSPSDSAKFTQISMRGSMSQADGDLKAFWGGGGRKSVGDVDAVQFKMSSGNITSGTIRMYGIVNS